MLSESAFRVASALNATHVRWVVFGSTAGVFYGLTRQPRDLDILALGSPQLDQVTAALPRNELGGWVGDGFEIYQDCLTVSTPLGAAAFSFDEAMSLHIEHRPLGKLVLPILGLEDWLALKLLLHREEDDKSDVEDVGVVLSASIGLVRLGLLKRRLAMTCQSIKSSSFDSPSRRYKQGDRS